MRLKQFQPRYDSSTPAVLNLVKIKLGKRSQIFFGLIE